MILIFFAGFCLEGFLDDEKRETVKVAAIQFCPNFGDVSENAKELKVQIELAAQMGAKVNKNKSK